MTKNMYKHETLIYFYLYAQPFESQEGHRCIAGTKKKITYNIFLNQEKS